MVGGRLWTRPLATLSYRYGLASISRPFGLVRSGQERNGSSTIGTERACRSGSGHYRLGEGQDHFRAWDGPPSGRARLAGMRGAIHERRHVRGRDLSSQDARSSGGAPSHREGLLLNPGQPVPAPRASSKRSGRDPARQRKNAIRTVRRAGLRRNQ